MAARLRQRSVHWKTFGSASRVTTEGGNTGLGGGCGGAPWGTTVGWGSLLIQVSVSLWQMDFHNAETMFFSGVNPWESNWQKWFKTTIQKKKTQSVISPHRTAAERQAAGYCLFRSLTRRLFLSECMIILLFRHTQPIPPSICYNVTITNYLSSSHFCLSVEDLNLNISSHRYLMQICFPFTLRINPRHLPASIANETSSPSSCLKRLSSCLFYQT